MFLNELKKVPIGDFQSLTKRQAPLLQKLGIFSVFDLLDYFPFRYEDRSRSVSIQNSILYEKPVTVIAQVIEHGFIFFGGKRHPKILIQDENTRAYLVGFNRDYLRTALKIGKKYWIYAQFIYKYNEIQASSFDFEEYHDEEKAKNFGFILPIYQRTESLYLKELRNIFRKALEFYLPEIDDELPEYLLKAHHLISKQSALKNIHFPEDEILLKKAKLRLAFEEFFAIQLAVALKKQMMQKKTREVKYSKMEKLESFIKNLPYQLTGGQEKSLSEIIQNMNSPQPMHRLLQGDVGCGKTTVALATMIYAAENGFQSALMAPTEVLAIQHFLTIQKQVLPLGLTTAFLSSSLAAEEKERLYKEIREGAYALIVGTHALIQEGLAFKNLCLIIFDEQHRFGVEQRIALSKKGKNPDILVMTATPIPRTLTMTLYGDLDVSIINELPAGRKNILTKWFTKKDFSGLLRFVSREIQKGRQAYFIYPLIEESEKIDVKNAVKMYELLVKYFDQCRVGLLHGRLSAEEKRETLGKFTNGSLQILVSTTVVEVGIDVANATVMVIEGAERFGLSQLHQLRGRVGRGEFQSYCALVTDDNVSPETKVRMETMVKYNDGFQIAEEDLKLRGPGEILGIKQSGMPELKIVDYMRDEKLLLVTKQDAANILEADPGLEKEVHQSLKNGIISYLPTDYLYSG
jgi:ATP-dependent DNA helicase RecG